MDVIRLWGLSDSSFLDVYIAALAASIAVPVVLTQVLRRLPAPRGTGRDLGPYEVACLKRGPRRVAMVAVAELSWRGALHVRQTGRVKVADLAAWAGSEAERHGIRPGDVPDGTRTETVLKRVRKAPGTRRVCRGLQEEGLLVSGARMACIRWLPSVLLTGLLLTEATRLGLEMHGGDRIIEQLSILLVVTILVMMAVIPPTAGRPVRPTARGSAALKRIDKPARGPENYLLLVALDGISGMPSLALREALMAGCR
ncbi:MAG: TIGR04222 domain-containing membrane protein [Streptosporangiales bacterium]|nr:TIGR04222 domain-containing membrane protein [Streptosporangiales bacterium]